MIQHYTLKIGAGAATKFPDLGITGAILTTTFGARDSLTITTDERIDTADIIPAFARCELRDPQGILRFVGWLDQAPRRAAANAESKTYTLTGPIRWLERIPFTDTEIFAEWGHPVLGWANNTDRRESIGAQVARVATVANAGGANLGAYPGGNAAALFTPYEKFMNASCLTALTTITRWAPAIALVSDGTDALAWRDSLTSTTHAIADILPDATDLDLNPHYDLLRSTVILRWFRRTENGPSITTDTASGGDASLLGAAHTEQLTIEIGADELPPPTGIAAEYHRWAGKLHLSCTVHADGLHWSILPAHRITFGGLLSPWSAYDAVVQILERDLATDTLRITTGPRRHLGLDQLGELARRSALTTSSNNGPPDTEPEESCTITRTIEDPQSGTVPGAYYLVNGQSRSSGASITVTPGTYTISYVVPPDYVPPANESVTLAADDTDTDTVTATWRDRLRLRRADGQDGESIDLNVADIPADKGAVNLTEYYVVINGALKKSVFLASETPYDP
jgi:hypothetical protein